jgi:hypothetical protein
MTMLRRYEIYQVDPNASKEVVAVMDKSMRHAQRWIPEVLHSAVGYNKSPVGLSFVWEHGYEDSAAYKRYMVHPFHANIYDRYLLNDSPERAVVNNPYDVGLLGFNIEGPQYFLPSGYARRVALVRLKKGTEEAFKALTEKAKAANPKMVLSLVAENTFATRWMDGVTKMLDDTTYSHIWEQGYKTLADAEAASTAWQKEAADMIEDGKMIELWYELETGDGYDNDAAAAMRSHGLEHA